TAVTMREDAIYPSIVVGKPPAEDAWLGKATERIFLPAVRMTVPEIVDYDLPIAGVFHNCCIVSIRKAFPGHAKKVMHAIWGLGMLSLTKAVVVVDQHVDVHDYEQVFFYVGANVDPARDVVISEGPLDHLDHAPTHQFFGFLWVRDVPSGSRRRDAGVEPAVGGPESATEGAPAIPADRGEAAMPSPEPGETFSRNVFLEGATLGLGGVITGIVTVPILGFAIGPVFQHQHHDEVDLGPISNFKEGQFMVATFLSDPAEGEVSNRTAYIRNNGFLGATPSFTAISNRCAHLGCPVQPNGPIFDSKKIDLHTKSGPVTLIPTLPAGGFGCPCHGGQYDQEGNRTAGPPVRALDRYEFYIRNGH